MIRISSENISGKNDNLLLKRNARLLFLEDILFKRKYGFTHFQIKSFLFEYGILIKEFNCVTFYKVFLVFLKFVSMGYFYDSFRFLRRIYYIKTIKK